ncbi:MAG: hypothetical protein Q8R48_07075, partial [Candidatus Omnitrophota bacterium]|nr:hypothetical protein [Candidatus Omnitrophota bacterium]
NVTYPLERRSVNTQSLTVTGLISGNPNAVILINGVTADITGNTFSALINLIAGANTITVQAYNNGNLAYDDTIQIAYKPSSTYENKAYEHIYNEMDKYYKKTLDFRVELQSTSNSARVKLSSYHTIGTNMQEAQIPLSAFQGLGVDLSGLIAIAFAFDQYDGGTIYFDDIRLVNTDTGAEIRIDDFADGLPNNNLLSLWTADGGSCALSADVAGEHKVIWDHPYDYWYTVIGSVGSPLNGSSYTHLSFRIRRPDWATPRLIESYVNTGAFNGGYMAKVYDSALSVTALLARGTPEDIERAKILSNAFVYCQQNDPTFSDGRIRDEYWSTSIAAIDSNNASVKEPGSGCGNLAWVIIALLQTYEYDKSNTQFLDTALELADFIQREYYDVYPGYKMGYIGWEPSQYKIATKSTENNAALYAAFYKLYKLTGDTNWRTRAESIYNYLEAKAWNSIDEFFWRGGWGNFYPDRANPTLDANTLSLLALGKINIYTEALTWIYNNTRTIKDSFTGFDFNTDKDGVWFEGTAQAALAYKVYGRDADSNNYLAQLHNAQSGAINNNGRGIVAASHDGVTTGFEDKLYYAALHIGATSWFLAIERETNLLWGEAVNYNTPSVKP